jgi:peptide chain release factor
MDDKWRDIAEWMGRLMIKEGDLVEKFILGSGKGGQKVNKTSSCVYLKHVPSGIEIKCQKTRSRDLNRIYARRELCERIEEGIFQEKSRKQMEREKIRRQKRRRSRRSKEKMLADKKILSSKKELRRPPSE